MGSRERTSSAQSRTAWGNDLDGYGAGGGHGRPDNQFDFGPRDDPDLPQAMENDGYMDKERDNNKGNKSVDGPSKKKKPGCLAKIGRGIRCKICFYLCTYI